MPIDEEKYIEEFGAPDEINSYFDKESALEDVKRIEATEAKEAVEKESELKAAEVADQEDKQRQAELEDSHAAKDPSEFGVKENLAELKNAFVGGTRDTLSSYATAPERIADITSGAMVSEIQEKGEYKPGFNPLGGDLNPLTKTWW